ncbi:hypothetical protein L211DRAFT_681244 [Terfezia boudieri ATCC MYA-4762]|uniref:Uncharacterized protein n=1 Tax=Terfezia boudieri ATCC MYA-4762 TaxID=1051890 RepID=A0A3N4LUD4_9PEZI|nr:hypothetical protein L211DRAFT_681244 [Terfezia boudieri ATCC MYA-4762]
MEGTVRRYRTEYGVLFNFSSLEVIGGLATMWFYGLIQWMSERPDNKLRSDLINMKGKIY